MAEVGKLNLYSDPACAALCAAIAAQYGVDPENVIAGNGSDELLSFAFRAFCGAGVSAVYADITYGFYKVWAQFYGLESVVIPSAGGFFLNIDDYIGKKARFSSQTPTPPRA